LGVFVFWARERNNTPFQEVEMKTYSNHQMIAREQVVQTLMDLRREFETASLGYSLLDMQTSVGLILSDIADNLGLCDCEKRQALGPDLVNELDDAIEW
jgi:hypothetical protein